MKKIIFLLTLFLIVTSCNEDEWLKEKVYSFYVAENSYSTPKQIDIAVVQLYRNYSEFLFGDSGGGNTFLLFVGSDVAFTPLTATFQNNNWSTFALPTNGVLRGYWNQLFKQVYDANVIIGRLENVEYRDEEERNIKMAEAKFFRALAYKTLVVAWGDVPLIEDELKAPKRDYVRSPVEDVMALVIEDLTFASQNLPNTDDVAQDGRLAKGAAFHALSEAYIFVKDYPKAITAATEVIDNMGYALMENRFGTRKNEPGDVYWDLFRRDNQNRGSGNTESIYVSQYEYLKPGGEINDNLPRFMVPMYWQLRGVSDNRFLFEGPSAKYGGRGIGWGAPSNYMTDDIWLNSGTDIRNSEYNIMRDIVADNPSSDYYGQKIISTDAYRKSGNIRNRNWTPIFAKYAPINNFPEELPSNSLNNSHRDRYVMRLAETYLLRAEAHLLNSSPGLAADDINKIRARASAPLIDASDVDMEFILDERARELFVEETRVFTLMRMGKLVERVRVHHPMYNGVFASNEIFNHNNLWPIPVSEIERNTEADLTQNPGY